MRKPKTVEIVLRVRVPADWSAAHTRREVIGARGGYSGEIYALGPPKGRMELLDEVVLRPRWGAARVVPTAKR